MRRNYEAILPPSAHGYSFSHKKDAITFAVKEWSKKDLRCVVKCRRTGQITHILHRSLSSCQVCGNELEGKKHCSLCGELHYYA